MSWLSFEDAAEDLRQLLTLLTESHPDPYSNAGGPVALHRRVADIYRALPEGGLSRLDFLRRLRPLIASLQDGHTLLFEPGMEPGGTERPALPLAFDPVDALLYVGSVYREEDCPLLGQVLVAVDGVPFAELVERMARMRGADNQYSNLVHLADALVDPPLLAELLERESVPASVDFCLRAPNGEERSVSLSPSSARTPIEPPSPGVTLPPLTPSDLGWGFLRDDGSVACLRVASLVRYREAFEINHTMGHARFLETYLPDTLAPITAEIPKNLDEAIALVPSAAEQLGAWFGAMRDAGTKTLIVDLRDNGGGNSFFAAILGYYLYGLNALLEVDWGYQIPRYSPLFLTNYPEPGEDRKAAIDASLMNGGYDFAEALDWERRRGGFTGADRSGAIAYLEGEIARAPSFARVFGRHAERAIPDLRVVALTSARTYSAGFDVAAMLVKRGATLVGIPSGQAGNCYIDGLFFTLDRSQLTGIISYKLSRLFPHDSERGRILRPDRELTYESLASVGFDRNAAVALALQE